MELWKIWEEGAVAKKKGGKLDKQRKVKIARSWETSILYSLTEVVVVVLVVEIASREKENEIRESSPSRGSPPGPIKPGPSRGERNINTTGDWTESWTVVGRAWDWRPRSSASFRPSNYRCRCRLSSPLRSQRSPPPSRAVSPDNWESGVGGGVGGVVGRGGAGGP